MSEKANPTLIGAFVLGSIVLTVGGLVVFGGGRFFTERVTYVAFFNESVGGLSTGAAVNFRGVKVGEVDDIQVHVNADDSVSIPVYLQLQRRRLRETDDANTEGDIIEKLIERGMRAQLEMQSIVTGQLQIHLDFHPDQPPRFAHATEEFPEMPTIPSTVAEFAQSIEELSIEELVANAQQVVAGLNRLVNSPDLAGALTGLNEGIRDLQQLMATANREIDPLSRRVESTLREADATLLAMRETMASARDTMDAAADSLSIAAEGSPVRYELQETLEEIRSAARSVRLFVDYLERNPDALLRGKPGE